MSTTEAATDTPVVGRRRMVARVLGGLGALAFAAFWVWALFFASKEPINQIGDTLWAERAEQICAAAEQDRLALADFREMQGASAQLVRERADIVDRATDVIEEMLDDVVAVVPDDAKGRALVPQWEAEYRIYIGDRRAFADRLRETGENDPFYESQAEGLPISERLETFAGDNKMPSCAPPRDLTR